MLSEPLVVVARLAAVFDEMGIEYVIGGSLASSMYGVPRATQDVDLVADLARTPADASAAAIARALTSDFYVDSAAIREAIQHRDRFNVVHLPTMFKADVFIAGDDPWSHEQMSRGRLLHLDVAGTGVALRFASAEDVVLHKLVWYKLGDASSERQWRDVLGVLRIQAESLDRPYLKRWGQALNVGELLARAMTESRVAT
jgi:hypothetical protein